MTDKIPDASELSALDTLALEHWKPKVFYVPVVIVEENHKDAIGLCMVKPLCEYDAQTGGLLVHMGDMIPAPEEE